MTTPTERTRSLLYARDFLLQLLDPKLTPRLPKAIRREASNRLRHYPSKWEISQIGTKQEKTLFCRVDYREG